MTAARRVATLSVRTLPTSAPRASRRSLPAALGASALGLVLGLPRRAAASPRGGSWSPPGRVLPTPGSARCSRRARAACCAGSGG